MNQYFVYMHAFRDGSKTPATSKIEFFVTLVHGWKLFTDVKKNSILDVARVLGTPESIWVLWQKNRGICWYYQHFCHYRSKGAKTSQTYLQKLAFKCFPRYSFPPRTLTKSFILVLLNTLQEQPLRGVADNRKPKYGM